MYVLRCLTKDSGYSPNTSLEHDITNNITNSVQSVPSSLVLSGGQLPAETSVVAFCIMTQHLQKAPVVLEFTDPLAALWALDSVSA